MVVINNKINAAIIIAVILFFALFLYTDASLKKGGNFSPDNTHSDPIIIKAEIPESPSNVTIYRVTPSEFDMVYYSTENLVFVRPNVTSEADALPAAQTVLLRYGGLPQGAKLTYVKTEYIESYNSITNEVTAKYPISTNAQFSRYLDDMPVVGDGGHIYIDLGNDGELLYLNKVWRTVTSSGSVPIIPLSTAIEKISSGEYIGHHPKCSCTLNVDKISLGYYEKGRDETQEYLDPVWIFSGTLSSGDSWKYYVYASDSASSSMTMTSGNTQIQVQTNATLQPKPPEKSP